jgi:hypothetical protein
LVEVEAHQLVEGSQYLVKVEVVAHQLVEGSQYLVKVKVVAHQLAHRIVNIYQTFISCNF